MYCRGDALSLLLGGLEVQDGQALADLLHAHLGVFPQAVVRWQQACGHTELSEAGLGT